MPVVMKYTRKQIEATLWKRVNHLLNLLEGRDLVSASEGARKGYWRTPEALCMTSGTATEEARNGGELPGGDAARRVRVCGAGHGRHRGGDAGAGVKPGGAAVRLPSFVIFLVFTLDNIVFSNSLGPSLSLYYQNITDCKRDKHSNPCEYPRTIIIINHSMKHESSDNEANRYQDRADRVRWRRLGRVYRWRRRRCVGTRLDSFHRLLAIFPCGPRRGDGRGASWTVPGLGGPPP